MTVLVTGCSGYVGHQVAARLARANVDVIGTSRRPWDIEGVEVAVGDHQDEAFVANAVGRCDAVIHFAGRVRGSTPQAFERDNQEMTTRFCREAARVGARFIYISSDQAVYRTGHYGDSKRACEEIVQQESDDYVVLRLSAVLGRYAPEMASTFSSIIQRLRRGPFLVMPGSGDFPIVPVWIGDIDWSLRTLLRDDRRLNEVFELCGTTTTLEALIDSFERRLGVRRPRLRLPLQPLQAVARSLKPWSPFARLPLDALLDLGAPVRVSPDTLTDRIGFQPTAMEAAVSQIEDFPVPSGRDTP
jgi:nucleoside-diphosphate-sugar epimerase